MYIQVYIQASISETCLSVLGISLAYLLTSTVFQPIFGRGTDLYGSRLMLFISIAFFDLGTLFCAVATNFPWFCAGRAVAGTSDCTRTS